MLTDPPCEIRHYGFGDSAIELALVVWIPEARELIVASRLRFAITRGCRTSGIEIPLPQREIQLHPPAQA